MLSLEEFVRKLYPLWQAEQYEQIIEQLPEELLYERNEDILFFFKGVGWHGLNELDKAIAYLTTSIALSDDNPFARLVRGQAFSEQEKFNEAIKDYDRAIELMDDFALAFYWRGNAWLDKEETQKANADYSQAILLDPELSSAYSNRGLLYLNATKEYDKAIADGTKVITLRVNDPKPYNNRGIAYFRKGEIEHAIADFDTAIRLYPEYEDAINNRKIALAKRK
jgi:tetratricopeptide (TPR) repeat protein